MAKGDLVNNFSLQNSAPALEGIRAANSEKQAKLQALLLGQQKQADVQNAINEYQGKSGIDETAADSRFAKVRGAVDEAAAKGKKISASMGKDAASYSENQPVINPASAIAADRLKQGKVENLSKRYENLTDFNSALQDIEKLSDTGSGGVLKNPQAQLPGTGKVQSAIPDAALGLAESIGLAPKGTSEMRKSLSRLQLGYARALGGARGVNPMMLAKEKEAMGYITSGDPELVKKGVLSLAENVKNHYKTIQSGYTPDVVDTVHQGLGGNPIDAYSQMPAGGPAGAPVGAGAAPQAAPSAGKAPGGLEQAIMQELQRRRGGK